MQVGDPFAEKLLIEATLELMATGAVAAIQDMGAAGLTSSSVEMAGKGGVGIELNMDMVPQRETGMSAYEMMLSESQERMLAVLKPGREHEGHAIFEKWGLDAAVIGYTTDTGRLVLKHHGETVCDVPLAPLFDDAPLYDRPWVQPPCSRASTRPAIPAPTDWNAAVLKVVGCPDMASKRWLWEQYDRHVMADTLEDSATGCDAGIVRIHGTGKAIAVTSDVTPRYVQNDPYEGGKQAVAEAWRNLTAAGSLPIAITDNLNFGSPEKPETMGQIVRATDGMAEACRALDFPVVSGNVALQRDQRRRHSAHPDRRRRGPAGRLRPAHGLRQCGRGRHAGADRRDHGELGASIYLREILGREDGAPPPVDLAAERKHGDFVRGLIPTGLVAGSARPVGRRPADRGGRCRPGQQGRDHPERLEQPARPPLSVRRGPGPLPDRHPGPGRGAGGGQGGRRSRQPGRRGRRRGLRLHGPVLHPPRNPARGPRGLDAGLHGRGGLRTSE